jgi:anti-anti-sigma factor
MREGEAVELGELDFVNSIGLRVLLLVAKRLAPVGGQLVACGVQGAVLQTFRAAGFLKILRTFDSRAKALAALASSSTNPP